MEAGDGRKISFQYYGYRRDQGALRGLAPDELGALDEYVHDLIRGAEDAEGESPEESGRDTVAEEIIGRKTYRLEYIRCGRGSCRCAAGRGHGPYWYEYRWEGGRTRSRYIGKKLRV